MRILLKILNYFFVTLGVLFFLIIILGIYFFVADPFGLKPLFSSIGISPSSAVEMITDKKTAPAPSASSSGTTDKNPLLTVEQEKTLESMGIDAAALPTAMTPELEKCLVEKLGKTRADEIVKGSTPTPLDFLKASVCLK